MVESLITSVLDTYPQLRETKKKRAMVTIGVCTMQFFFGLACVTDGGGCHAWD